MSECYVNIMGINIFQCVFLTYLKKIKDIISNKYSKTIVDIEKVYFHV